MTANYSAPLPQYLRLRRYSEMTGISVRALECKIHEGKWLEGREFIKSQDGKHMVDWQEADRWHEGENA